jgi:hypothetical protein
MNATTPTTMHGSARALRRNDVMGAIRFASHPDADRISHPQVPAPARCPVSRRGETQQAVASTKVRCRLQFHMIAEHQYLQLCTTTD